MSPEKLDKAKVAGYLHTDYPAFKLGGIEKYDLRNVVVHQIQSLQLIPEKAKCHVSIGGKFELLALNLDVLNTELIYGKTRLQGTFKV